MSSSDTHSAAATLAVINPSHIKDEFDPNDMPFTVFSKAENMRNAKYKTLSGSNVLSSTKKEALWKSEEKPNIVLQRDNAERPPSEPASTKTNKDDNTKLPKVLDADDDFDGVECLVSKTPPPTYEFTVEPKHAPDENDVSEDYELDVVTPLSSSSDRDEHSMTRPDSLADSRQAKRRKNFIKAVEVPTVQSIFGHHARQHVGPLSEESEEEIKVKLEKLKNPKVKKNEGRVLSLDTVRDRLRDIGYDLYPIPLDKSVQDVEVTRLFLSKHYGGGMLETFPTIGKKFLQLHKLRDFMYPNLDFNPHAPEVPGAPGLFFEANRDHAGPWPETQRVITRIRSGWWLYQGQYHLEPAKSLTKEEWASQKPKFRNTWAKEIFKTGWGKTVRARIFLRERLGRRFTEEELAEALNSDREYHESSPEKILQAFASGEEFVSVWTMKCVGYDTEFQSNLANKFPSWVPPPSKPKAEKGMRKLRGADSQTSQSKAGQKRKRAVAEASDEERDSSDVSASEDSDPADSQNSEPKEVEAFIYRPRGTRSRPIVL